MVTKRLWLIAIVVVLLLAAAQSGPAQRPRGRRADPGRGFTHGHSRPIYRRLQARHPRGGGERDGHVRRAMGAQVHYTYDAALQGFAATLPEQALNGLRHNPNVEYIEVDSTVSLDATQTGATWGLDRIDQAALPLNDTYTYNYTGAGVKAYIIDTGIRISHNEFGGRASDGYDAVDDVYRPLTATGTARTWRARSAAPPTVWPRGSAWWPCAC